MEKEFLKNNRKLCKILAAATTTHTTARNAADNDHIYKNLLHVLKMLCNVLKKNSHYQEFITRNVFNEDLFTKKLNLFFSMPNYTLQLIYSQ